jgi:RNA polymerase sigma-70 factor (ECF subfamily)
VPRSLPTLLQTPSVLDQEADLVRGLRSRDAEAWAELYDTNYERLRKYAIARTGSREEAEDLASQVYLRALHSIDSYKSTGRPIVFWLYGIMRNLLRELSRSVHWRVKQSSRLAPEEEPADDSQLAADVSQLMDLQAALSSLTERQRDVVTLLHFAGFNVREVAAMFGICERSVYYLEARALLRLRDELSAQDRHPREKR